ncbi:MAG: IPT/TIG domain-containing protein [Deltaproteobacteria bacterium]|nr:IPT/TIG domain-containing protein [Deltaproteobacteria bacterium]
MRKVVSSKLGLLMIVAIGSLAACKKSKPPTEECRYVDGERICEGGQGLSAPSFDQVSPASARPGSRVIITGKNFEQLRAGSQLASAKLKFGRVEGAATAAEWVVLSPTELEAVVPADAEFGAISLLATDTDAARTVRVLTESEDPFSPDAE